MNYSIKDAFKSLEQLEEENKSTKSTKLTEDFKVGDKIKIVSMSGEPQYTGKKGEITRIDDLGQLHGTWGGLAIIPEEDDIEVIEEEIKDEKSQTAKKVKDGYEIDDLDKKKLLKNYTKKDVEKLGFKVEEDTKKLANGKWTNVGKDGKVDSGTFKTKKEADAQRRAIFANGYKEGISEARGAGKGQSLDKYFRIVNKYNDPYNQVKEEDLDLLLKIKDEIIRYEPKSSYEERDKENLLDIIEYIIDESKYEETRETKKEANVSIKEARESKLEKEGIQYFGTKNQFNYDKLQLRIDHDNKTFQLGAFTHISKRQTVSGPELRRIIKRLEDAGYKKVASTVEDLSVPKQLDLIDFIKKTIEDTKKGLNEYTDVVSYFDLDNILSVIFVWEKGYEKNDLDYIYSEDGKYVLTVGVGIYEEDFEGSHCTIPYLADSYEEYDSFYSVYVGESPRSLAKRLLQVYDDLITNYDIKKDGKLYPKGFENVEESKSAHSPIKETKRVNLKSIKKTHLKENIEDEIKAYLDWCKANNKDASNGKVFLDYCQKFNIGKSKKEDDLEEGYKNSKYSLIEIQKAVEDAFGYTGKERDDYIKKTSSETLDALVDGFKDNAKKSFFADSLNKNCEKKESIEKEKSNTKCDDMKSCLDKAVKQLTSTKEGLNQNKQKILRECIGNYRIYLSPRCNSRGEYCVRVYENFKRDINKSFYTKDYNEAVDKFKQIGNTLKKALKESLADKIERFEKSHELTPEEIVVFENAIDCLWYGYGFKYCNTDALDDKDRAREIFKMAHDFLGDLDESLNEEENKSELKEDKQFSLRDSNEVEDAKNYLNTKKEPELEQVVDVDANNPEQLKTSYIGDILLRCGDCRTVKFKKPEEVVKDENTSSTEETQQEILYNVGEECPHCGSTKGYTIAGQVVAANIDLTQQDEEETSEPTQDEQISEPAPIEQNIEDETTTEIKDEIVDSEK